MPSVWTLGRAALLSLRTRRSSQPRLSRVQRFAELPWTLRLSLPIAATQKGPGELGQAPLPHLASKGCGLSRQTWG